MDMGKTESNNLFFRVDLLTGCNSLVSFSDALSNNFDNTALAPLSMIAVDVHGLSDINETRGREFGDSLLRWFGFAIKDITGAGVYRVSGDGFIAVLVGETHGIHTDKARLLYERLNRDSEQFGLEPQIARVTLLHFPDKLPLDAAVVWKYLNEKHKFTPSEGEFNIVEVDGSLKLSFEVAQAIVLMARRITDLGYMLENTFGLAYTDPISGSPNMLAVQHKLDLALGEAMLKNNPISICLMDGDDLRRYNTLGYSEGDNVIRKLHVTLASALRPDDFFGRWRMGDEFIVIMPDTNLDQAAQVCESLRATVEQTSEQWLYPTTISGGIAGFPVHGNTTSILLKHAERALKAAKKAGKNRVRVAD
jgi:diguanylate cyclase (GGDEF)-like protein